MKKAICTFILCLVLSASALGVVITTNNVTASYSTESTYDATQPLYMPPPIDPDYN